MREPVGRGQGKLQGRRVRYAGAIKVGRFDVLLLGQGFDLGRGTVHEHHSNIERTQHRHVQQDIREILVSDDRPIDTDHKNFFAELRDVLEDAAKVSKFHINGCLLSETHD